MGDQQPTTEINRELFAPHLPNRVLWAIEDGPIGDAPILAWNLAQGAYPRYQAIDGPVEIDNLPPKYAHLEDFQVLGLLELRGRGGISADLLQQNWPLIFTSEGFVHWYRRPLGRPGVLQGENGRWYIAMVGNAYLLVGGGDPRAQFQLDREHRSRDRVRMKDVPWISTDHAQYLNEDENPQPRDLLIPSCIELDLTTVHWPTVIDITRMPRSMIGAVLMGATDGASDGFVDAGKVVIELIKNGRDKQNPFQLPDPETYTRAQLDFEHSTNPILFSLALFDGRLEAIRAEQRAKDELAQRCRERLARPRRVTTISLQRELGKKENELTATKRELAEARNRIGQYEQALDALFQSRQTIRTNEPEETARDASTEPLNRQFD